MKKLYFFPNSEEHLYSNSCITAQQEISSLEEKVAALQRDLSSYETQLDHLRRDGTSKAEAGRASEGALHSKISHLKEELHNNRWNYQLHRQNILCFTVLLSFVIHIYIE